MFSRTIPIFYMPANVRNIMKYILLLYHLEIASENWVKDSNRKEGGRERERMGNEKANLQVFGYYCLWCMHGCKHTNGINTVYQIMTTTRIWKEHIRVERAQIFLIIMKYLFFIWLKQSVPLINIFAWNFQTKYNNNQKENGAGRQKGKQYYLYIVWYVFWFIMVLLAKIISNSHSILMGPFAQLLGLTRRS